jgi:UPF0716 protein FxsA
MVPRLAQVALLALPFAELALLIKTGQSIGWWPTLALLLGAAVLGALIIARQGLTVARRVQEAVARGRPPVGPVLDGAFMLLAGTLLIAPGFITDAIALALLVGPIRRWVARAGLRRLLERGYIKVGAQGRRTRGRAGRTAQSPSAAGGTEGPLIEGEFERLGEQPRPAPSGKDAERAQPRSR